MNRRTPRRRFPIEILESRTYFAAAVTFAAHVDFVAGTAPIAIAAADFNGDGNQDVVVADNTAQKANIFFGNGAGSFTAGPVLSLTAPPVAVVVGDFNGDGKPDIVVASSPGSINAGTTVTVFLNNGTTFGVGQATTVETGVGTDEPVAIATGDFNADGKLDVVITENSRGAVAYLGGTGAGTFAAPVTVSTGTLPTAIAAGDFNGDGKLDFAVTDTPTGSATNGVSVYAGTGAGSFAATPTVTALNNSGATALSAGLLNADTRPDLVVGNAGSTATVLIAGGTSFTTTAVPTTAGGATGVVVADFNVDGVEDFVVADGGTSFSGSADAVTVVPGIGGGQVQAASTFTTGNLPTGVAVADFNNDGKPDIATANEGAGTVSILLNSTTTTPITTTTTLTASSASLNVSSPLTLTSTVTAASASPLAGESIPTGIVNFYDGQTLIGPATITAGVATLTVSTLTIGSHNLTARYRGDTAYAAGASAISQVAVTPTAATGPDLVGAVVAGSIPDTLVPGEVVPFKVRVTNGGNTAARGVMTDSVYLSADATYDTGDVALPARGLLARTALRLNAGKSANLAGSITLPTDLTPGTYYILVVLNQTGSLPEFNLGNNTVASAATPVVYGFGTVGGRRNVVLTGTTVDNIAGTIRILGPGTGIVTVGDGGTTVTVTGTTLASSVVVRTTSRADLNGLTVTGPIGSIQTSSINLNGPATFAGGVRSLSLGSASAVSSITAPWVGSITTTGDFKSAVTISGVAAPRGVAINSATIKGAIGGVWSVTGNVNRITAATAPADWSADVRGTLGSLTTGTFAATVAAARFSSVLIRGNMTTGEIVAGMDYGPDGRPGGGDDTPAAGTIGSVRVTGSVTTSLIGAGVDSATAPAAVITGGSIKSVNVGALDTTSKVLADKLPAKVRVGVAVVDPTSDSRFKVG